MLSRNASSIFQGSFASIDHRVSDASFSYGSGSTYVSGIGVYV